MRSDDRIMEILAAALAPGNRRLAEERVAALRTHILATPGPRPRATRRVAIAFAVLTALAGGMVLGHELPRPLRIVAHDWLGLPVDSTELVDAYSERDRLGRALSRRDADEVIAADRAMLALVKLLDPEEKEKIVPVAHEVHERAVDLLRELGLCPPAPGVCPPSIS